MPKLNKLTRLDRRASIGAPVGESIPAVLATSDPVAHAVGDVVLVHTAEAANLSRADDGLIVLFDHNTAEPIGRVDNVRLEGGKTRGDISIIGTSDRAANVRADLAAGIPYGVSISFGVQDWDTDENGVVTVSKWDLLEASIVPVPRDTAAGLFRSMQFNEGRQMPKENQGGAPSPENAFPFQILEGGQDFADGQSAERERSTKINGLFSLPLFRGKSEFEKLRSYCIEKGATVEQASMWLNELAGRRGMQTDGDDPGAMSSALPPGFSQGSRDAGTQPATAPGATSDEKFAEAMQFAIEYRGGLIPRTAESEKLARSNPFTGLKLDEMARAFARHCGVEGADSARGTDIVSALMDPHRGIRLTQLSRSVMGGTTSDFPALMAASANKAISIAYAAAPSTWAPLALVTPGGIPDFKQGSRPALSAFSGLDYMPEGSKYEYADASDVVEYITAKKYGKKFVVSRESILGDDLGALRVAAGIGTAAARTLNENFWALYMSPPTLNQDAKAVFDADHNNEGTAGAPSVTSLSEHRKLHRLQKDPSGNATLNAPPAWLIVAPVWETEAGILVSAQTLSVDLAADSTGDRESMPKNAANQFGNLGLIVESIVGGSAGTGTTWFTQASPAVLPYLEVGFVGDQREPYVDSRESWDTDGVEHKVRHEYAVAALDFRGIVLNDGA